MALHAATFGCQHVFLFYLFLCTCFSTNWVLRWIIHETCRDQATVAFPIQAALSNYSIYHHHCNLYERFHTSITFSFVSVFLLHLYKSWNRCLNLAILKISTQLMPSSTLMLSCSVWLSFTSNMWNSFSVYMKQVFKGNVGMGNVCSFFTLFVEVQVLCNADHDLHTGMKFFQPRLLPWRNRRLMYMNTYQARWKLTVLYFNCLTLNPWN